MSLPSGTHVLGPRDGRLTVRTGKTGAASKAGHNLLFEVGSWEATIEAGEETSMSLTADARSFSVLEGTGGMTSLGEAEKTSIGKSIDDDVLKGGTIAFRSTGVTSDGDGALQVDGELDLLGEKRPIAFALKTGEDGRLTGGATVKQSDWGMKPFSTLFGTLKVADEVQVELDARLPTCS